MKYQATIPPELLEEVGLLEQNLRNQLDGHQKLLKCVERNREAIRKADMEQIKSICQQENVIAQQLAELEKWRLGLVGRLTQRLEPDADEPLPLDRIAAAVDEPLRRRLNALAGQLRIAVDEVRTASGIVRAASDALSRHMTGLMQSVQSVLASAKVYGCRGRLVSSGQNQYCVDVKS